jgi:NADPH-dependent curcumin reductase CurA
MVAWQRIGQTADLLHVEREVGHTGFGTLKKEPIVDARPDTGERGDGDQSLTPPVSSSHATYGITGAFEARDNGPMSELINQQWRLAKRPEGLVADDTLTLSEQAVPELSDGQFRLRILYLSLDPTNRVWMNETDSYLPAVRIGDVMRGGGIGIVEESKHPGYAVGDHVSGLLGWQRYLISDGSFVSKLPELGIPLTAHFGLLAHIGITAYFGVLDIGKPKPGETLVVSAAAGAVGSIAGQIGKISGCRVVGIAGSDEKCEWLTGPLGFDAAINYRKEDLHEALKRTCPKGIDIYFENVGGKTLEAVLDDINLHARIPVCGMISTYNQRTPAPGPSNLSRLVTTRSLMQGFLVSDYMPRAAEAVKDIVLWHAAGKLHYRLDIVKGLEAAPKALNKLFDGSNLGKLIVEVSPE